MHILIENRKDIIELIKQEGYENIFLDLQGYRTGSISPDK